VESGGALDFFASEFRFDCSIGETVGSAVVLPALREVEWEEVTGEVWDGLTDAPGKGCGELDLEREAGTMLSFVEERDVVLV